MKKISGIIVFILILFFVKAYAQEVALPKEALTRTADVNKDGSPDIIYHRDGKYVAKIEADSNYDGKPDIVVHAKDGKFASAEVDSNYDGKPDRKFSDLKAFNQWLNANNQDFYKQLNSRDWDLKLLEF